jgi:general secretion pathway protein D
MAVALLTKAVQDSPQRADYRIELERAMIKASLVRLSRARELDAAGERESAVVEYRKAVEYDPSNRSAMMRAAELERILRDEFEATRPRPKIDEMRSRVRRETTPLLNPASRDPIDLRFANASTKDILDFIGDSTGINVTYERDFRPQPFSIQLNRVTLEEALQQIMSANQLWYKVINDRTILIIPTTPEAAAVRGAGHPHLLHLARGPAGARAARQQITRLPGAPIQPVVAVNKTANTITVRATARRRGDHREAHRANDKPRAEIVVDVEILEVNRARAKEFGLNLATTRSARSSRRSRPRRTGAANPALQPEHHHAGHQRGRLLHDRAAGRGEVPRHRLADAAIAKPQLRGMEGRSSRSTSATRSRCRRPRSRRLRRAARRRTR